MKRHKYGKGCNNKDKREHARTYQEPEDI